jgi:hypothetical protein
MKVLIDLYPNRCSVWESGVDIGPISWDHTAVIYKGVAFIFFCNGRY